MRIVIFPASVRSLTVAVPRLNRHASACGQAGPFYADEKDDCTHRPDRLRTIVRGRVDEGRQAARAIVVRSAAGRRTLPSGERSAQLADQRGLRRFDPPDLRLTADIIRRR